jgi:hypothetical protein
MGLHNTKGLPPLICAALLAAQACVSAELPAPIEEPPIRNDGERPGDPSTDPNAPRPDMGGQDMADMADDMVTEPDLAPPDMPPADMTVTPDMSSADMDQPDMPPACAQPPVCVINAQSCVGDRVRTCVPDANGCPSWSQPQFCPTNLVCMGASCQPIPEQCVDRDGDGRGTGCAQGPDCDDNDPSIYPGARELCDNRDNNCNNLVDDGVPGVGAACTAGIGACQRAGSQVCDSQGNLVCDAVPGTGTPERCDGADNNCDGQIDEGGVCMSGMGVCMNDTFQEPNDTNATAWPLAISTPLLGLTCTADKDFYILSGLTTGQSTRVHLAFDHAVSDLDLRLYRNGSQVSSSLSSSDHEAITFTPQANSTYTIEIRPLPGNNNVYRVLTTPVSALACSGDDAFAPNYSLAQAAFLVRSATESSLSGLQFDAYHCGTAQDDWYDLGDVPAGKTIWGEIWDPDCIFSCPDFDLELLWYNPATGATVSKDTSVGSADNERVQHTVTASDAGRYYLRVYSPLGDRNNYVVTSNRY